MIPTRSRQTPASPYASMEERLMHARCPEPGPGSALARLGRFLRGVGRPVPRRTPVLAEAMPWLLPKVRSRRMLQAFCRRNGLALPAFRPLAGNLVVSLVVDLPNQDLDLDEALLAAWNVDFERLLQHARRNLLERGGERGFLRVREGCYRSGWRDNLDGSRMLLPGILQRLPLKGAPVVLLPNRDTLLVVGAEDPGGLGWASESARLNLEDPAYPVEPMRLRDYQWEPWDGAVAPAAPLPASPWNPVLAFRAMAAPHEGAVEPQLGS